MQNKQYIHTNLLLYCSKKFYTFNQVSNNESELRNFTHLIRCQTMKVKPYIILNTSRKHFNYEEVPMNKPCNIQNTNICNGIFHISFFKALLINECETTRGEREQGRNDPRGERDSGRNDPDSKKNLTKKNHLDHKPTNRAFHLINKNFFFPRKITSDIVDRYNLYNTLIHKRVVHNLFTVCKMIRYTLFLSLRVSFYIDFLLLINTLHDNANHPFVTCLTTCKCIILRWSLLVVIFITETYFMCAPSLQRTKIDRRSTRKI